jgi:hypothetical protein
LTESYREQKATYLEATFSEELISGTEWYLNYSRELCHFLCSVILDIRDALNHGCIVILRDVRLQEKSEMDLEISYELFHDGLPCDEAFDKDVGRTKVMRSDILFDQRLRTRYG